MVNINEEDIDLRLALGSRHYDIVKRLNSSSGAGVNANSRVHMPFSASDPLTELVWSPHNDLVLKCANSSLADNKTFLMWNVGENSKEIPTSQSTRSKGNGDIKVSEEEKLIVSATMLDGAGNCGGKATVFSCSGGSSSSELDARKTNCDAGEMEEAATADATQEKNNKSNTKKILCSSQNVGIADIAESSKRRAEQDILADGAQVKKLDVDVNWKIPCKHVRGTRLTQSGRLESHASRSDIMGLAIPIRSETHAAKESEALVSSFPNLQSRQEPDDEVTSASEDLNKNKTRMPISIPALTLMRLESSAENELGHLTAKEAHILGEAGPPRENSHSADRDFTNSRIYLYQEKGKEKDSSEGDMFARSSNDEDDSHETVESCNSAGLLSKGTKRQYYDQRQLVGSKRTRKQIQGTHDSASIAKPDSSFMNWICNMVKGLTDSNKEESSPLIPTLAPSNNVCNDNHQENFMCKDTTDCTKPNMGFHTVFQSLYGRTQKESDGGVKKDNLSAEYKGELMVADKEVNPLISGSPSKPWIQSVNFASTPTSCERSSAKDKASDFPDINGAKGEVSSFSPLCEKVSSTGEKTNINIPLPISCMPEKSSPLSNLWITRLYTRTARLENCNQITEEAGDCSFGCPKANLDNLANDVLSVDQNISEARDDSTGDQVHAPEQEMQRFSPKASIGFTSTRKLRSNQIFSKIRSSEAMASVFSKRLDALKHIMHPSENRKSPTCLLTCFFCGRSGHELRQCPELTEIEVENFLLKVCSFESLEEYPCLCIRCFQLNHWAISCPLLSSDENRQSEHHTGAVNQYTICNIQLCTDDDHKQVPAGQVACRRKSFLGSYSSYLTCNLKETSSKKLSTLNELQKSTSSSQRQLKDQQMLPPCNYVDAQNAVSQVEMFHAIRKLRLSRADILRWMNSNVSFSHLNGFFLRLRLGKLEEGLGGTSYYVAFIAGDTMENIESSSKRSILVDIGGIKSSIGSQYISNHDFLEDEIKAWWGRLVKTGGKIPTIDELNSKLKDRKRLCF